jgi:hypothetical protein
MQFEAILEAISEQVEFKKQMLLLKYQNDIGTIPDIVINTNRVKPVKQPQDHKKKNITKSI